MESKQQPVKTFRYSTVEVAIWANKTENGVLHKVTFNRFYRQQGDWKTATSFNRDDLLLVAKLANKAHSWIFEQSQ